MGWSIALAGFKVKWIQQSFSRLMAREAREHEYSDRLSPWLSGPALGGLYSIEAPFMGLGTLVGS